MRKARYVLMLLSILVVCSCKKNSSVIVSPAAVNIINAIQTSQPIIPIFGTDAAIQYFANARTVSYARSAEYSPLSGANTFYIVQSTDTTTINPKLELFNGTLNLLAGGIYSFFLTGDTTAIDTLFVQDHIPVYSDSSAGVRFVNLSTGSLPISVNIQGNPPTQTEFNNLAYKNVSSFNKYLANSSVSGSYTFEVRDQVSGTLLTTFTWNFTLFKNNTLVIAGLENNSTLIVFQVNNY